MTRNLSIWNDLRPYTIGFDDLFSQFDHYVDNRSNSFPPYNIVKGKDDLNWTIEMALAGYNKNDIEVKYADNTITIKSTHKGMMGVIEASMNATIVSLMTVALNNQMENVMGGGDFQADEELQGCIKELRDGLKSKERMLDFDKFCSKRFDVHAMEASVFGTDEGNIAVDSHLEAKS